MPSAELASAAFRRNSRRVVIGTEPVSSGDGFFDRRRLLGRRVAARLRAAETDRKHAPAGGERNGRRGDPAEREAERAEARIDAGARDIAAAVRTETNPGMLTLEDLATYQVKERPPVCMTYRTYEICGMGPPSSGALTVGQMLGMLLHFDLPAMGPGPEATHLFLEAGKLAFADRGLYMADSDFVEMPEGLLDPVYLAARAALIDPARAMEAASPGEPPWKKARLRVPDGERPNHGTTHFVIVDRYDDMLTATTTIETNFGSRVVVDGFLLNNELTDFAFVPEADGKSVANRVEGGKRPRSSMSPTMVFRDGAPMLLIGSPGGANIIPYIAQALVGILDFGLDPQVAVDSPHVLSRGGPAQVEQGPEAAATIAALDVFGHQAEAANLNSGLQAILIGAELLTGAADKRREGLVMGQ